MTIHLAEGFDASNQQLYWTTVYPTMVVNSGTVAANQSLLFGTNAAYLFAADVTWDMPLHNGTAAVATLGFFMRGNSAGNMSAAFRFEDAGSAELCTFEIVMETESNKPEGGGYRVRISKGGTPIATSVQRWPSYQDWVYHEIKVTFSATVGTFEGRYTRGHSNAPTAYTWNAGTTGLDLGAGPCSTLGVTLLSTGTGVGLDDLYLADDYLHTGPIHIIGQWPVIAGAVEEWTPTGAASTQAALGTGLSKTIDEGRIVSPVNGDQTLVTLTARESLFTAGATILAVVGRVVARMDTAGGDLDVALLWRNGATTVDTSVKNFTTQDWEPHEELLEDDPTTAVPWVFADWDGLQLGVENQG
jgi:hypothetical protein